MMTFRTLTIWALLTASLSAQVSFEQILASDENPADWPTYSGAYHGRHYRELGQITRDNVANLQLQWVYQGSSTHTWQATPLVVDGVMYFTEGPNNVVAVDAATGREFWKHEHKLPTRVNVCCGRVNRGVALLGDKEIGDTQAPLRVTEMLGPMRYGARKATTLRLADRLRRPSHRQAVLELQRQLDGPEGPVAG
jgi:glucose dehydrogenase